MKVIINKIKDNYDTERMENRYFNEINIEDKFKFCSKYIDTDIIKFSSHDLVIKCIKFINSSTVTSDIEKIKNVKKLVICGYIDAGFFVEDNNECFFVKRKIPFNTCIVVPNEIADEEIVKINYCIEDMTILNIECNLVYIVITLFLEYAIDEICLNQL